MGAFARVINIPPFHSPLVRSCAGVWEIARWTPAGPRAPETLTINSLVSVPVSLFFFIKSRRSTPRADISCAGHARYSPSGVPMRSGSWICSAHDRPFPCGSRPDRRWKSSPLVHPRSRQALIRIHVPPAPISVWAPVFCLRVRLDLALAWSRSWSLESGV